MRSGTPSKGPRTTRLRKETALPFVLGICVTLGCLAALHLGNSALVVPKPPASGEPKVSVDNLKSGSAQVVLAPLPVPAPQSRGQCHPENNAEYEGTLIKWGADFLTATAEGCCKACSDNPQCNVWVWCYSTTGCGGDRLYTECWLKKQDPLNILEVRGTRHPASPWMSGAIFDDQERQSALALQQERLDYLKRDPTLPLVWMDITINSRPVGRMTIVLFKREAPLAVENFRQLCTGEAGVVPQGHEGAGQRYHFKGKPFYRIVDRFILQAGATTDSVYGGYFKDDPAALKIKHDRKGLLSMANANPNENSSHFTILLAPAPHLDGRYGVFGEIVEGIEVAEAINALARGQPNNMIGAEAGAVIADSGQVRCGEPCGLTTSAQHGFAGQSFDVDFVKR